MDIVAVVFKYGVRAQGVAQHPRILFNDAGVGSRQNDSVQMMPPGVLQGESSEESVLPPSVVLINAIDGGYVSVPL